MRVARQRLRGAPLENHQIRRGLPAGYASVSEARAGLGRYLGLYSSRRPHSSLDGKTPDQANFIQPLPEAAAV
ncbi:transposase [Citreicella sp. C3M06]|uniref:integrase core domain-containing protein n=1 Tax=Citreicella sp. C3M06 TaxID=2841564 RepID=UPI001C095B23|nr:transposase [Citreicella sp. C3M06]